LKNHGSMAKCKLVETWILVFRIGHCFFLFNSSVVEWYTSALYEITIREFRQTTLVQTKPELCPSHWGGFFLGQHSAQFLSLTQLNERMLSELRLHGGTPQRVFSKLSTQRKLQSL
jgi:hypothetical protein